MTKRISSNNIYGNIDVWAREFPPELVHHILTLICEIWLKCLENYSFTSKDHETRITRRLKYLLQQERTVRKLPVSIQRELPEEIERGGEVEEKGRVDLVFIHGYREDVYLAFECKRLNVTYNGKRKSQASEYVGDEGLSAYVQSWYSEGLQQAGMIGYVMDGDIEYAQNEVNKKIIKASDRLKTDNGLKISAILPGNGQVRETTHHLTDRRLRVHHIFLSSMHRTT